MSSRYSQPRDRSPPRHFDRRPSTTYTPGASTYRGTADPPPSSQERPPPRGPKADFRGTYQFGSAPRGRGAFSSRGSDTWDRDRERDRERDARNQPPPYRHDEDRGEWPRRERDFAPSDRGVGFPRDRSYVGRDRSASPDRPRRNSKENLQPAFPRPSESSSYYGPATRGGTSRGRGRGDWDRSRGRSSFVSEREREYFPRSRSREDWRDRDYDRGRPSGPDAERGDRFDRREYDRTADRESRGREHDVWQRDRSPGRNSTGRPASPGAISTVSQHGERYKGDYDPGRKPSLAGPLSARGDARREGEPDYFSSRVETPRRDASIQQQFPTTNLPPSSSIGLDYGPPASVPATPSASTQEKPATKPTSTTKPEQAPTPTVSAAPVAPTAPVALQPPSGPKADRIGPLTNAPSTPRAATQPFDQWTKAESASRSIRSGPIPSTNTNANEANWKPSEGVSDNRASTGGPGDRPLPANTPSGPRAATNFRGRLLSNEQVPPNAPPTAPRHPKASALENKVVPNAPTGPRSSTFPAPTAPHNAVPTGPQAGSNRQWVAPDYRPPKPSIMNQLKPYQSEIRERQSLSGPSSRPGGVTYQSQQSKPKITQPLASDLSQGFVGKPVGLSGDLPSGAQTPMEDDIVDSPVDVEMSLPASDEEDVEDDDGLDEDYFAASEETHLREMKLLESKKPLPAVLDPTTATLIIRIQLLNSIILGLVPEAFEEGKVVPDNAMDIDKTLQNAPPSPERTPEERPRHLQHPKPHGRPLSQPAINPIPTPPIDDLPYLNDAMEEFHVFEDSDNEIEREAASMLICQQFEHDAWEHLDDLDDLKSFYKSRYPQWRREVEHAEIRLREVHRPSPAPASPAPSATPSLPPGPERPGGERTRGARNTTDLDMQQAILMSQQSAKEEEERREREAASNALPNYDTEAVVPDMLKPSQFGFQYFEDMNNMIDLEYALDLFNFVPPEDDFTGEEQAAFIAAYCQNPKKWGKIADSLPSRSYQDCIMHYYLTKDQANYKEHWRRSQPKRGRRRAANVKPRANNLMSDLALNEEGEGTPVAVTDSGRPRRAAAPTFGDPSDPEAMANAPQAKRLKDSNKDAEPTQPKPRGRKGAGTGKGRKPKDKILVDPSAPMLLQAPHIEASIQKPDRVIASKERNVKVGLKAEASNMKPEQLNASLMPQQMALDGSKMGPGDIPLVSAPVPVVQPAITSYWSVPEQQKFPELVQYYGRDFDAIAAFLKTKSATMIKNHYIKEVNAGKHELEQFAADAAERRARDKPLGPLPTPIAPPKRRYEANLSVVEGTRAPVAIREQPPPETESMMPHSKSIIDEFPSNNVQRISGELVSKPRPSRENLHRSPVGSHVQPKMEDPVRERSTLLQKPMQGPPRGLFQEEPITYPSQQSQYPNVRQDQPGHQRITQVMDIRATEPKTHQPTQQPELRASDFGRNILPGREQNVQPQQQAGVSQYQAMTDRQLQASNRASHGRNSSLMSGQGVREAVAADLASLRNMDTGRAITFNTSAAHSPAPVSAQTAIHINSDPPPTARHQPRVEPAKPAQPRRSNLFGLLNNDTDEPPSKRPSLESAKSTAVNTPPPQPTTHPGSMMQNRLHEENSRPQQPPYAHVNRMDPHRPEYRQDYSSSPAPGPPNDWIDRNDPRPQNQSNEPRAAHNSPAPGQYSLLPPSSQPNGPTNMSGRYDPARGLDQNSVHRRSLLGISHAPSPPPQQQQPSNLHRSSSGSSQHGRGTSMNYPQNTSSGPPSYPQSTSSTPVSNVHHRNQHSIENQPRMTIQQYKQRQQEEQRREIEIMQQQHQPPSQMTQQPPPQQSSRMGDLRDMYGPAVEARPPPQNQMPPASQTPQPQPMTFATAPPPGRTYTPPHPGYGGNAGNSGHGHTHMSHQQAYQSHQSQYSHAPPPGPAQHHPAYQHHPGYPQAQSQNVGHQMGGRPPPGVPPQQQQGHYRGYSLEDRR